MQSLYSLFNTEASRKVMKASEQTFPLEVLLFFVMPARQASKRLAEWVKTFLIQGWVGPSVHLISTTELYLKSYPLFETLSVLGIVTSPVSCMDKILCWILTIFA